MNTGAGMKSILVAAIVGLLISSTESRAAESLPQTELSIDLAGLEITMALEQFSRVSGAVFIVHPNVKDFKGLNVRLENVPVSDALRILFAAYRVCGQTNGNITKITPCQSPVN
jgi:type II secretory pathway component GspD/PulD (secretin)